VPLPGGVVVVVLVALPETPVPLSLGGETTSLPVLVDGVGDPVDSGISSDSLVLGVDEDDLVVLVDSVLVDPVRVQDPQVGASSTDSLLGGGLETSLELEVVDTLPDGLTVGGTLGSGPLPVSPPDPDSVDDESLLGLVSQPPGLVGPRGPGSPVNNRQLPVLPASDTLQEQHDVALLLVVQLGNVLVGTHLE